jgi:prepilin-type N-terminal cleavage/methylation domain-containing protein
MQRNAGFTLLELMIVVSIVAILTAIAVPSFNYLNNRRITQSQVENLHRALTMARQTAVISNRQTIVCPSANGTICGDANAWSNGFMIYEDRDNSEDFSSTDRLLEYIPGVRNVVGRQNSSHLIHHLTSNKNQATFSPLGFTPDWQTFIYCDGDNEQKFKISLIRTGRIKVESGDGSSC